MAQRLTTGIAYRLGWTLYWIGTALAVLWLGGWLLVAWYDNWQVLRARGDQGNLVLIGVVIGLPALLAYGPGRLLRYVLADE